MLAETIRVLVVVGDVGRQHYPQTLFAASEAEPGRCTARSTIYVATIAAALMVHQFVRWLRRQPVDPDTSLNLLASEMVYLAVIGAAKTYLCNRTRRPIGSCRLVASVF